MYSLIVTTKMNDIDPQAWLADAPAARPAFSYHGCRSCCLGNWCAAGVNRQMVALMARPTHVYTIGYVATLIGENLDPVQEIASNFGNIDYGEMIHAHDGREEGVTTFTDRGVESLKGFFDDIRP